MGSWGAIACSAAVEHVQPDTTRAPRQPASTLFNLSRSTSPSFDRRPPAERTRARRFLNLSVDAHDTRFSHARPRRIESSYVARQPRCRRSRPDESGGFGISAAGGSVRWTLAAGGDDGVANHSTEDVRRRGRSLKTGIYAFPEGRPVQPTVHPAEAPRRAAPARTVYREALALTASSAAPCSSWTRPARGASPTPPRRTRLGTRVALTGPGPQRHPLFPAPARPTLC